MPRPTSPAIPSYRFHKRSGQAIVTLSGRMFYLGPFDSSESRDRYNEVVADWLANGRQWPETQTHVCQPIAPARAPYTILELIYDYWQFAQGYYVKKGQPTSEHACIRAALRALRINYGRMKVDDFSPLKLQNSIETCVGAKHARVIALHDGRE